MSDLNRYLTYKALHARYQNHDLLVDGVHDRMELSNVCFKVTDEFKHHLERVCSNLGCSRREFLTKAVVHALEQADTLYDLATEDLVDTGASVE